MQDNLNLEIASLDAQICEKQEQKYKFENDESELELHLEGLQKHSDIIKARNLALYEELEAISKADDYVREQL